MPLCHFLCLPRHVPIALRHDRDYFHAPIFHRTTLELSQLHVAARVDRPHGYKHKELQYRSEWDRAGRRDNSSRRKECRPDDSLVL
ncbi:hypothetical protein QQF64_030097 [Cirrhinus molitorella]|uniref:Uncharacterized protein n=1 Tax=Cirrhinus molitorella TaxID=172907 RepID=A0ABR3N2N9_9TELE